MKQFLRRTGVAHVKDVLAALASRLTRADVHGGRAERAGFAYARRTVAEYAGGVGEENDEVVKRHVFDGLDLGEERRYSRHRT